MLFVNKFEAYLKNCSDGLSDNSLACVADSLLDCVARDKGLFTILDEQFRKERSLFNFQERMPGYDYRKRLMNLARTNFKVLIEYNGDEWVKNQNFRNMEKEIEMSPIKYGHYLKNLASIKKRQKINKVIEVMASGNYKTNQYRLNNDGFFKSQEELDRFLYNLLEKFKIENEKEKKIFVDQAFKSGLLIKKDMKITCSELRKEKLSDFYDSIKSILYDQ